MRPGISNETLTLAGVRAVSPAEAQSLCGLAESGLWLPYRNLDGSAIRDGANDYGRLRLDQPRGDMKYYQAGGTIVHAYLPPMVTGTTNEGGDLFIIEGEFKSLSLTEAGFPAVGISGFYGFGLKGGEALVPELAAVITQRKPTRILFCGDSDTALNYAFSHAVVRLAKLVDPLPVWLPRIPLNGPGKGADDCRAALNGTFMDWWQESVAKAILVKADAEPASLAVELFELELAAIASLNGLARMNAENRLVQLAVVLKNNPLVQERLVTLAVKNLDLSRRGLNKAVAAMEKAFQNHREPKRLDVVYDPARKCYWIPNDRGEMIEITESALTRHLASAGFINDRKNGNTQLDDELNRIQCTRDVQYAGPLAGQGVGLQEMCGQRILVTRPPRLLQPAAGESPTIEQFIIDLFDDPDHPELDQIQYVLSWLKVSYESMLNGELRPGQLLAIAGPRDCGKSLLQALITEILGGRSAKPYRYMSGATEFNGDLFAAEHLMIEDEVAFTDIRARRHFGARIKDFTVNTVQSCHAKNRPALSLKPFWRNTITLNDEPENLLILPPIDDSLEDKIILLRAKKARLPADIGTAQGRKNYWAQLMRELPAFLDVLVHYQIPGALHSGRFGVKHFQHPALMAALSELSPEERLLALIDSALEEKEHIGEWSGTATDLERMLAETKVAFEARRLLDWNNAAGTYLGRLAKKHPNRVRAKRTNHTRQWTIYPANWCMGDDLVTVSEAPLVTDPELI
jgi:hypothetical protein